MTEINETAIEHAKKMESALNNIVDPAVKEYLQLLRMQQDADNRFFCESMGLHVIQHEVIYHKEITKKE